MKISRILAVFLAAAAPAAASAQQQAFGTSLDLSAGVFTGAGGTFTARGGPAIDGVLAMPLSSAGTTILAVTAGISGSLQLSRQDCPAIPGATGCLPAYPSFASLGLMAGMQRRMGPGVSARALAGPAYYRGIDNPDAFGLQGRVDLAKPLASRMAIVGSLRGTVLPSYQGETLSFAAFGLGLRIQ